MLKTCGMPTYAARLARICELFCVIRVQTLSLHQYGLTMGMCLYGVVRRLLLVISCTCQFLCVSAHQFWAHVQVLVLTCSLLIT